MDVLDQRFVVRRVWALVVVLGAVESSNENGCVEVVIGNVVLVVVFAWFVWLVLVGVVPLVVGVQVVGKVLCGWVFDGIVVGCLDLAASVLVVVVVVVGMVVLLLLVRMFVFLCVGSLVVV